MGQLVEALQQMHLAATQLGDQEEDWLDSILEVQRPRKKTKLSKDTIKEQLEEEFLTPSTSFNTEWLNKLQQRWDTPTNYADLFAIAPTQTRTIIRFNREGLEGRVSGYKEITVPASSATAKNSTSLLRKPANRAEFVRGAAGFFPFAPGGLDGVEAIASLEDQALQRERDERGTLGGGLDRIITFGSEGGLLEVPPGFSRGMKMPEISTEENQNASEVQKVLEEDPEPTNSDSRFDLPIINGTKQAGEVSDNESEDASEEDIDSLLPIEFPALAPRGQLSLAKARRGGKEWAHMVDINRKITNFKELVPDMAQEFPFELDTFQKEAVYHLESGDSVFVAAHTSAGKTVVAEYAIALAAKHMTKAIYTSPIKALSNQKFRDFRQVFDDVGILTGDVQIRPEASCLIMTTEILRSMLYRGADLIRDVEFVIFDEVHYVNDLERGVVWEEVIIMLPEHVTLILLSATVPNTYEFASWVGRTKKKDIYVISTPKRPVPLEHYLWANKAMHRIVTPDKQFLENGWKDANDALSGKDKVKAPAAGEEQVSSRGALNQRGGNRGGGPRGNAQQARGQRGGPQRGGSQQQRGRGQPSQGGRGNIARTGRGGGRTTAAQDRNIWVHLVQHLRKEELLPACIFVFSKKRCEENADALSNLDYCTAAEKSLIHMTIEKSIARLKPEDRQLPQIRRQRELLSRGFAVHHGGMLPILKEVVEILFAKTLVKVLFATETFAMGLNLPTRTVVFSGFRKHDGRSFRDLLPGEYTQMAGRAGRRGLDPVGSVIIVTPGADEAPPAPRLRNMILGDPTKLRSQFRLTYNMILNLLRVEALKIEEMIKRSFSENATQALLPEHEKQVKLSEADLDKIKREPCDICNIDLEQCHQACITYQRLTQELHLAALGSPVGRRMFSAKRLIVYKSPSGVRSAGMLLRDGFNGGHEPTLPILEISTNKKKTLSDLLPYLGDFAHLFTALPNNYADMSLRGTIIPISEVECVTETVIKIEGSFKVSNNKKETQKLANDQFIPLCTSWTFRDWEEVNWRKIKDLALQNLLDARAKAADEAQNRKCLTCPKFLQHFSMQHDEWLIRENIAALRQLMSDQNLQLLPDYEQRISVLKELGFVDENSRVELKGKVACEIHTADELVLTELVLENVLADYEPEEIVALLSAFVFQEKTDVEPTLTANLERGKKKIIEISERVNHVQTIHQVIQSADDSNDFISQPRFGMVEVVYEWARGMSFNRITDLTDVMEGTIVRLITRLDETCREVKNAARIIGDPSLYLKMQTCQEMIKRDIMACASLYM
ncbi:antiviral helicase [Tothia fuscella]|uniref:Antiviral helicase n=1 Tax=Tothia fuscella TaxID=1048955 RepID=A0A9P4TVU7_9PEZI|nr:antiviral helicase [Tothia fuscella]